MGNVEVKATPWAERIVEVLTPDVVPPTATIHYSITGATNQDVVASLTGESEPITITNNSGSRAYAFTGNASFTFEFVDAAGNTGATTATVSGIDKTAPALVLNGGATGTINF